MRMHYGPTLRYPHSRFAQLAHRTACGQHTKYGVCSSPRGHRYEVRATRHRERVTCSTCLRVLAHSRRQLAGDVHPILHYERLGNDTRPYIRSRALHGNVIGAEPGDIEVTVYGADEWRSYTLVFARPS